MILNKLYDVIHFLCFQSWKSICKNIKRDPCTKLQLVFQLVEGLRSPATMALR